MVILITVWLQFKSDGTIVHSLLLRVGIFLSLFWLWSFFLEINDDYNRSISLYFIVYDYTRRRTLNTTYQLSHDVVGPNAVFNLPVPAYVIGPVQQQIRC